MEYFSLIPENGGYNGIVKIPESVAEKWAKLPEELDDISKLKVWVNKHFPQEKCIVILFDIWSGIDVSTLEFLIRESHLYSTLKYFYKAQKYAIFKKVFLGDNQSRHSPLIIFLNQGEVKFVMNGFVSYKLLRELLTKFSKNLTI